MKTKTIRQSVTLKASPHEIYEVLMDSKKHSKVTESKAHISKKIGGKFSVWGGSINGTNLELVPDKKIVQAWRSDEDTWPKGHYSKATFLLGKAKSGTRLKFVQTDVPIEAYESTKLGWRDYYWEPLKTFLKRAA